MSKKKYKTLNLSQLIRVKPYGLTPGLREERPIMIFKSLDEKTTVAVPLSHLDAGISVAQSSQFSAMNSPHKLGLKLIEDFGQEVKFCFLKEVKGHHVFVEVHLGPEGSELSPTRKLEARADEAISFCLQAGADFYVDADVVRDLLEMEAGPRMNDQPPVKSFGFEVKKTPYLM